MLKDRRFIAVAGSVAVIVLALGIATAILRNDATPSEPPASQTGLVIDVNEGVEVKRDPNQQYRCFKDGLFVGMATLDECARTNGVVSGALDVGVDETGALAAADQLGAALTPLPPEEVELSAESGADLGQPPMPTAAPAQLPANRATPAACQRYDRGWSPLGDMPLGACLQALFAGRCEREGGASYGRWGELSLRLTPGRIEQSRDERIYRPLVDQSVNCTIPQL